MNERTTMSRNDEELIASLKQLIRIKSVKYDGEDTYEPVPGQPFGNGIASALEYTLQLCASMGMITKNCDGYVGYAQIGQGEELFGILVHLDVVPEGNEWDHPPYGGDIEDGRIYGRGAIDDKGPAMAAIYALKDLIDEGFSFKKRIRLIFGTDEESGWEDMRYYVSHEECPAFGVTPDADFPLVYGEMGIFHADFVRYLSEENDLFMEGGEVVNAVADNCRAWLRSDGTVIADECGKAAHACVPWEGENAISKVMKRLTEADIEINPEVAGFIDFYNEKIGNYFHGEGLGCDFEDELTGRLRFNAGRLRADDRSIRLRVDIRCPITVPREKLTEAILQSLSEYDIIMENTSWHDPVYTSLDSEFAQTLLEVYREQTGDDTAPKTMGGGTYARAMDNIVAFGPLLPGRTATEHMKNEHIIVEDLLTMRDIYREVIRKIQ